jgi:hypothetical protein
VWKTYVYKTEIKYRLTFKYCSSMTELFELSLPRFEYIQVHKQSLTEHSVGQGCEEMRSLLGKVKFVSSLWSIVVVPKVLGGENLVFCVRVPFMEPNPLLMLTHRNLG